MVISRESDGGVASRRAGGGMATDSVLERVEEARRRLGSAVSILGHHYVRDEVIRFADRRGDSLVLSRAAASARHAEHIVFCGVDFMAESAALLCGAGQAVYIPAREARCPMAAMADVADGRRAWNELAHLWGGDIIPITYQNSSAELKSLCGELGGAVCTSANAGAVFTWALQRKGHVLFFPDEHLGRNTALSLGLRPEEIAVWDPRRSDREQEGLDKARVVVWAGCCYVHTLFTVQEVERARQEHVGANVIVHPECPAEVVAGADASGSTSYMVRVVAESPPGAVFVIGTETNLVKRLAGEYADKRVVPLARSFCDAMAQITPRQILSVLESIRQGGEDYIVRVPPETARGAKLALDRMLEVV
jgi:quinolinate synthase